MGFSLENSVPVLTVLIQGLLSFFSPCVLPLVPVYIGYLAGGGKIVAEDGTIIYPRRKVLLNTVFFVLGISFAFFLLGVGFNALGSFFSENRILFARISGIVMILFGLYQFGFFGWSKTLGRERRFMPKIDRWVMGPLPAFLMGFTFSFAWTPCVGPTLGSVLLMAGSSGSAGQGFLLIGVYTIGFILPFLAVGLFTGAVLNFFKKHVNVVKYTTKIGAALLILMGIMTLTGIMNGFTNYLSNLGTGNSPPSQSQQLPSASESLPPSPTPSATVPVPAPDFTLTDQNGQEHTLSDYKGKTVFLNFFATWCGPCKTEMPDVQKLYENYGENAEDLVVLVAAGPNLGREGSVDTIKQFIADNAYTFPVVMDESGDTFTNYGISAFPTTFMIDKEGNIFGYVRGAITGEIMEDIVSQTMTGVRVP